MKKMNRKPTTPGKMLFEEFLNPVGMKQSEFAKHIEVDYKTVNRLVNGADLTANLAGKIAAATNTSIQFWMNLQIAVTIWEIKQAKEKLPKPIDFESFNSAMVIKTKM